MLRSPTLALLILLLLVGGLLALSERPAREAEVARGAARTEAAEARERASVAAPVAGRDAASPRREAGGVAPGAAGGVAADAERSTLDGRVVLELADGTRLERESGAIEVTAYLDRQGFARTLAVTDGRFRLPTLSGDPARRLRLERGRLGGRAVVPTGAGERWDADGGAAPLLVARPARGLTLHAVAAESGAALDGALAFGLSRSWLGGGPVHPGFETERGEPFAGPGPSPLTVVAERTADWGRLDTHLLVGAPGRVWRQVAIDGRPEGELVVELASGGAIEVRVTGVERGAGLRFELERTAGSGVAVVDGSLRRDLSATVDGLAPGAWTGRVARGTNGFTRAVYAEAEVEVVAGETVALTLEVPPEAYERESTHPTALLLEIPVAWRAGRTYWSVLRVDPPDGDDRRRADWLGAAEAVEDDLERHRLELGTLPVGDYVVSLERPPATVAFRVDGSGTSRARVAPPAEVRLTIREPDGATPAAVESFVWRPRIDARSYASFEARAEPGTARFEFTAPRGPLGLTLQHADGTWHHAELTVDAARVEHTWTLERRKRIEVRYLLDGSPHPIEPDAFVGARIEDAAGRWPRNTSRVHTRERTLFHVPPGERVRILPPRFPGFVTPEPVEFVTELGGALQLDLEYRPEGP